MSKTLIAGTRSSALAVRQTTQVVEALQRVVPDLRVQTKQITTHGDAVRDRPLSQVGGRGLFVKEIEQALLAGEIDLAVHSLKDVPTILPEGLILAAIPEREDPRDALVCRNKNAMLSSLPPGARVGTSSLRRQAQLLAARPDLEVVDLRGNVDTRLRKLSEGTCDAVVLAVAGLARLGYTDRISEYLSPDIVLPAVGQGALCVEIRADDPSTQSLVDQIDHQATHQCALAERAFLRRLEGGCRVPIGAYATMNEGRIYLRGLVASPDGTQIVRDSATDEVARAARLGEALADRVLAHGGRAILEGMRSG